MLACPFPASRLLLHFCSLGLHSLIKVQHVSLCLRLCVLGTPGQMPSNLGLFQLVDLYVPPSNMTLGILCLAASMKTQISLAPN